ncbi:alkaline phosphatase family protein [Flavobacteriales bacterium]|nr:alkaline phosphatase family protein [Flavobacteriales bacterium]
MYNEYFFVLDALRADHLKYMPWLNKKTKEGAFSENYAISEGFCERIEIFTKTKPIKLGFITAMTLGYNNKFIYPYKWLRPNLAKYLTLIEFNVFFTKVLRRVLWKICTYFSNYPIYPQRIPLNILHKVGITEDSFDFEKLSVQNKKGLIYKLKKKGFKIKWDLFTSLVSSLNMDDSMRFQELLKLKNKKNLFIPIYISLPDKIGHQYGPHSSKLIDSLRDLDIKCKNIISELLKSNPESGITIIGDHGMDSVNTLINIDSILYNIESNTGMKRFVDFDFFLDSTILRIWWKSDLLKKKKFFTNLKQDNEMKQKGYFFISDESENQIDNFSSIADFIWWAKKGVLINPDFFHKSAITIKGMHGYMDKDNPSCGFFLRIKNDLKINKIDKIKSGEIDELF